MTAMEQHEINEPQKPKQIYIIKQFEQRVPQDDHFLRRHMLLFLP